MLIILNRDLNFHESAKTSETIAPLLQKRKGNFFVCFLFLLQHCLYTLHFVFKIYSHMYIQI